jgi:crotonobetainyl-CoA hydratase
VPRAVALEWLLTGRRVPAAEAERWGLVNRVVPGDAVLSAALELADAIDESAPLAVAAVLEVVRDTEGLDVRDGFRRLRSGALPAYTAMLGSEDALEGPRAFAEGRRPVWKGR